MVIIFIVVRKEILFSLVTVPVLEDVYRSVRVRGGMVCAHYQTEQLTTITFHLS